jgi:hypothetical protein
MATRDGDLCVRMALLGLVEWRSFFDHRSKDMKLGVKSVLTDYRDIFWS